MRALHQLALRLVVPLALALVAIVAQLASCTPTPTDPGEPPLDQRVEVPAAGADVLQFALPETIIAAGADVIMCFIPTTLPAADVLSTNFETVRAPIAVHAAAMLSLIPRDAGEVFDCTNPEVTATLTPAFLPGAPLPQDFTVVMPADDEIVIRIHYINDTGRDVKVADVARFTLFPDAALPHTEVNVFVMTSTDIVLPPGPGSKNVTCQPPNEIQLLSLGAHMNGLGKSVRIHRNNGSEELYRVDAWTAPMTDESPMVNFTPEAPLVLGAGERVDMDCTWNNTTGREVYFPEELCASFSYAFPRAGGNLIICAGAGPAEGEGEGEGDVGEGEGEGGPGEGEGEGDSDVPWTPDPNCPDVPEPNNTCLPACGNDRFVGQPCTPDGGECSGHGFGNAIFCTVDFEPDAALAMCTKPCSVDSQCGADAVCIGDPADPNSSKGCVPVACSEAP